MSQNHDFFSQFGSYLAQRQRGFVGHRMKTAVLVPLLKIEDEWCVLFEERAHTLRRQAGEICFPGGHSDQSDNTEEETALRETCEELGLTRTDIQCLGALDIYATFSDLLVYPFVGILSDYKKITPNSAEVESIFTVPLQYLLHYPLQRYEISFLPKFQADFPFHLIRGGEQYRWRIGTNPQWFYQYENRVIWGLTARILTHFLEVVKTFKKIDVKQFGG